MKPRIVIPAFDAAATVGDVVTSVRTEGFDDVLVVDDGSRDETVSKAREAGASVVSHTRNLGKGAALRTGLARCQADSVDVMCTIDADGQHDARDLHALLAHRPADPDVLILGVRDLVAAGAPRVNQWSNQISNYFLSKFCRMPLRDTQCGLRRYPVRRIAALGATGAGYEFEAEVIVLAARARIDIDQLPVRVHYPPEAQRVTHFRTRRDVPRIIVQVLRALAASSRR